MPSGYVIVDPRTVRGPDGREHDVVDAINALPWTPQLCPLMRHQYTIWGKGPEWAWNVLSSMLLARNPDSFGAYFRGYQSANRYWDAPDGRRYWRGRFEIDRGRPDGVGQRRVDDGAKRASDWGGPPFAPDGIGLYDQDEKGRWWPTESALASGYLPCASCQQTSRKSSIVASPKDPHGVAASLATAATEQGRPLAPDELAEVLQRYPAQEGGASSMVEVTRPKGDGRPIAPSVSRSKTEADTASNDVLREQVVRKLLELRAREAPLGFSGYRGVLTQKAIADIAGVRVQDVTKAAIELEHEMQEAEANARGNT